MLYTRYETSWTQVSEKKIFIWISSVYSNLVPLPTSHFSAQSSILTRAWWRTTEQCFFDEDLYFLQLTQYSYPRVGPYIILDPGLDKLKQKIIRGQTVPKRKPWPIWSWKRFFCIFLMYFDKSLVYSLNMTIRNPQHPHSPPLHRIPPLPHQTEAIFDTAFTI